MAGEVDSMDGRRKRRAVWVMVVELRLRQCSLHAARRKGTMKGRGKWLEGREGLMRPTTNGQAAAVLRGGGMNQGLTGYVGLSILFFPRYPDFTL
ncbi:hypothetical protein CRG98_031781 [Punica granatum]|uniref:Uncharacterized protein n=1 Tax=Punica granatum TaxID=22663 RepID=A0A2I0IW02_PUNGR|nr:hypothetical protein CRG98_031781 [Punica granatum]